MQALPKIPVDDYITINASNKQQARGPHGLFRFFGKLPPDVTGRVLDLARDVAHLRGRGTVVDVMCGSGTTLIESADRGFSAVGFDVNPVARLYARVKTRSVRSDVYHQYLDQLHALPRLTGPTADMRFAATRNFERWFSRDARIAVGTVAAGIEALPRSRERDLLHAVLLGRLRRISNASERTGRIFYDPLSARDGWQEFSDAAKLAVDAVPKTDLSCYVRAGDARRVPLPAESADIVFCHPPYFGLYRYSSDVLRFELELGGFDRKLTAQHEIREGWKSGDQANLDGYISDMGAVFREGTRLLKATGCFALVASNSTLGDSLLPVIDRLAVEAAASGLLFAKHYERKTHHGSASYHRSARPDKVIQQDHVLLFTRGSATLR